MKFVFAAIMMAAAVVEGNTHTHYERPIEDSFVWMTTGDNSGNTRQVEVKRINK